VRELGVFSERLTALAVGMNVIDGTVIKGMNLVPANLAHIGLIE
jgi:hypothetical protein